MLRRIKLAISLPPYRVAVFTANSAVEYWIDAWQRSDPPYVLFCMSLVGSRRHRGLPIERLKRAINLGQTARRTAHLPSRTLVRAFLFRLALSPSSCLHHKAARRGGRETALLKVQKKVLSIANGPPPRAGVRLILVSAERGCRNHLTR